MSSELKKELCNKLIENNLVKEGDMINHSFTNNRLNNIRPIDTVQNQDNNISATLTTRPDCLGVTVKDIEPKVLGGIGEKKSNNGTQYYQQNRIYDSEKVALCQSAHQEFNPYYDVSKNDKGSLRIRKLSSKECWRLMGFSNINEDGSFDDSAYDSAAKVCSEAQLYKQAGNSIVVNVLMAIIGEML